MKAINVLDVTIGNRFICKVSVFEPDIIPGQKPGSRYYLRVTNIKKDRWYVHFDCEVENCHKQSIGQQNKLSRKRDDRTMIDD